MRDLDNLDGEIRATWDCLESVTGEKCDFESDTSELVMESGFTKPGLYIKQESNFFEVIL